MATIPTRKRTAAPASLRKVVGERSKGGVGRPQSLGSFVADPSRIHNVTILADDSEGVAALIRRDSWESWVGSITVDHLRQLAAHVGAAKVVGACTNERTAQLLAMVAEVA